MTSAWIHINPPASQSQSWKSTGNRPLLIEQLPTTMRAHHGDEIGGCGRTLRTKNIALTDADDARIACTSRRGTAVLLPAISGKTDIWKWWDKFYIQQIRSCDWIGVVSYLLDGCVWSGAPTMSAPEFECDFYGVWDEKGTRHCLDFLLDLSILQVLLY